MVVKELKKILEDDKMVVELIGKVGMDGWMFGLVLIK